MQIFFHLLSFCSCEFRQKYEESLPDGWPNIIQNRPEMFLFTQQPTNMAIVYKNTLKTESPSNEMVLPRTIKISVSAHEVAYTNAKATNDLLQCNEIEQKNDVDKLPPMKLPWDEPWWRIQTTAAFSPVDIWARNLDSEDWVSKTSKQVRNLYIIIITTNLIFKIDFPIFGCESRSI